MILPQFHKIVECMAESQKKKICAINNMVSNFYMRDLIKIVRKKRHCKLFSTKRRHISFVCEVFKVITSLSIFPCVSCVLVHIKCVHHKMIILLWSYFRTREIYFPFFIRAGVHITVNLDL